MLPSECSAAVPLCLKFDETAALELTLICSLTKTFDNLSTLGINHSKVLLSLYCHKIKSPHSKKVILKVN